MLLNFTHSPLSSRQFFAATLSVMCIRDFGFVFFTLYGIVKYLPAPFGNLFRWFVLKFFLKSLGNRTHIRDGASFWYSKNISIGRNCTFNEWVHLNGAGGIEIGDWVRIAHGSSIISENHAFDNIELEIARQGAILGPVKIKKMFGLVPAHGF